MYRKKAFILLAALLFPFPGVVLAANTYENISLNYGYAVTGHDAGPDAEAHSAFIDYVLTDENWTSHIRFDYLPEQNTQEDSSLTVRQKSYEVSVDVMLKVNINKKTYWGPRFNYGYHETEGTATSPTATTGVEDHADTLAGMAAIGYCLNDKSDIILTYTYRDDFLTGNRNNTRPLGLELLHTLKDNYSLHLRLETITERPDGVDNEYTGSIGLGTTF